MKTPLLAAVSALAFALVPGMAGSATPGTVQTSTPPFKLALTKPLLAGPEKKAPPPRRLRRVGGRPAEGTPNPVLNPDLPRGRLHLKMMDDRVRQEVRELFRSYELRNIVSFRQIVGINMRTTDDNKFGTSGRQMGYSVNCDFSNLRSTEFDIEVYPPVYNPTETVARVTVNWFRRTNFNSSGEEWIVRNQKSVLVFDMTSPRPKLNIIEGDTLFGLCNQVQTLVVDRGEIDGAPVVAPQSVRNGRLGAGDRELFSFGNLRRLRGAAGGGGGGGPVLVTSGLVDLETNDANTTVSAGLVSRTGAGAPQMFTISTRVFNLQAGTAGPFNVVFQAGGGGPGTQSQVVNLPGLLGNTSVLVTSQPFDAAVVFPVALGAAGSAPVFAGVDSPSVIPETNEGNNLGVTTIGFGP